MGKITFIEVAEMYANPKNPDWSRLAERSQVIYRTALNHLEVFFHVPVDQITRPMIVAWRDALYEWPGRLRPALAMLRNVLRYAHDRGYVKSNQANDLRGMPPAKPFVRWSDEQFDAFIGTAPERLVHVAMLALYTGQRRSDLCAMRWENYDGEFIKVQQIKTKVNLMIPVHPRLKTVLDKLPRTSPFILNKMDGHPWMPNSLDQAFMRHMRRAKLPSVTLHGLRKSAASKLAEAGCSAMQIAAITGHATLREITNYTKQADQKRLAVEAMGAWK